MIVDISLSGKKRNRKSEGERRDAVRKAERERERKRIIRLLVHCEIGPRATAALDQSQAPGVSSGSPIRALGAQAPRPSSAALSGAWTGIGIKSRAVKT